MDVSEHFEKIFHWHLILAEYHFDVQYKKVKLKTPAEALSRLLTGSETVHKDVEKHPLFVCEEDNERETISSYQCETPKEDTNFIEQEYDQIDHLLARIEKTNRDFYLNQMP